MKNESEIKAGMSNIQREQLHTKLTSDFTFIKSGNYLILGMGNFYTYNRLKKENPDTHFYAIEDDDISYMMKKSKNVYYTNTSEVEYICDTICGVITDNNIMKFDGIIMNPPYKGNLHLKILRECLSHLSEEGKISNLGPIRWITDPLSDYKEGTDIKKYQDVAESIQTMNHILSSKEATELFGGEDFLKLNTRVAVYTLSNEKSNFDYRNFKWEFADKSIFERIIPHTCKLKGIKFIKYDENQHKFFLPIRLITNPNRNTKYNIWTQSNVLSEGKDMNDTPWKDTLYKSKRLSEDRTLQGIPFNSFEEALNCYKSFHLIVYKYFVSILISDVNLSELTTVWLGDCINPRTGLLGYKSEWTDDDLCEYFDITEEDRKRILKNMEYYVS